MVVLVPLTTNGLRASSPVGENFNPQNLVIRGDTKHVLGFKDILSSKMRKSNH
jgi:hypothetical protein